MKTFYTNYFWFEQVLLASASTFGEFPLIIVLLSQFKSREFFFLMRTLVPGDTKTKNKGEGVIESKRHKNN